MRFLPLFLLALFWVADIAANWHVLGMEPVSVQIWRAGWRAQIPVGVALVVLTSHVVFKRPFGPA